jgi:hypothetical protein
MNALRLADGTMYPLFPDSGEDITRLTLYPASPGAHPVQINLYQGPSIEELSPLGVLRMEGSGADLSLVLTRDQEDGLEVVLTDLGNGTIATSSFRSGQDRPITDDESFGETGGWEEQLALVDNFESPESDQGLPIPDDSDSFDMDTDFLPNETFDESTEGIEEESLGAEFFGYEENGTEEEADSVDEDIFADDEDEDEFANDSDENDQDEEDEDEDEGYQALTRPLPHPLAVTGVSFLVLGICFAAAYGVFFLLKGESFTLLEQLLP